MSALIRHAAAGYPTLIVVFSSMVAVAGSAFST
jgi:hypothetical protein